MWKVGRSCGRGAPPLRSAGVEALESRRLLAAGTLDPTFSGDGVATSGRTGDDSSSAVVVQADGKVVVAGSFTNARDKGDFAVARFTAAGAPDPTFGQGGVTTTELGFNDFASDVLLQGGKIVVGGSSGEMFGFDDYDFALARYTASGQLDTTFGVGGRVKTEFAPNRHAQLYAMALQPDGKIVAVGDLFNLGDRSEDEVAVARYLPNGQPDDGFGSGGIVTYQIGAVPKASQGRDVALLPDGRILILADTEAGVGTNEHPTIGLLRLTPDGFPDDTFGDGTGARVFDVGSFFQTSALEVAPADGSVYVAGMRDDPFQDASARVSQFTAEGDPVTTFGNGGNVIISSGMNLYTDVSTALQPDGKLVVAANTPGQREAWGTWTIARLTPAGAFDTSFGTGGRTTLAPGTPDFAGVDDVTLAADGKIVAAGHGLYPVGTAYEYDMVVARLLGAPQPPVHRVSDVVVWGSGWGEAFKQRVGSSSLGGYSLPLVSTGAPLPWPDIDRISVRFSGDVPVTAGDLTLSGVRGGRYATNDFRYDPATRTATWSLAAPIGADRLHASVSPDVAVGGFETDFAVLPGDANRSGRVDAADVLRVRTVLGTAATPRGTPVGRHDVFADLDGSGRINVLDLVAARRRYSSSLPAVQGAAAVASASRSVAVARREIYTPVGAAVLHGGV